MSITVANDKIAIQAIISTDEYITEYLEFDPMEIYTVQATNELLEQSENKQQIFIFNTYPEATINPIIWGMIYQVTVSCPVNNAGTADLAIEQIIALLHKKEIANGVMLELIDPPVVLSSDTALYQIGARFVSYETVYNKPKKRPINP